MKIMEGTARRVQRSVFETCLARGELRKVVDRSKILIKPEEGDSLRVYKTCESCSKENVAIGGAMLDWDADLFL